MTRFTRTHTKDTLLNIINTALYTHKHSIQNLDHFIMDAGRLKDQPDLTEDLKDYDIHKVSTSKSIWPSTHEHPLNALIGPTQIGHIMAYGMLIGTLTHPLYYGILYADNRDRLRFYVPLEGNALNPINHQPFGEEPLADDMIANHIGKGHYNNIDPLNVQDLQSFFDINPLIEDIIQNIPHI